MKAQQMEATQTKKMKINLYTNNGYDQVALINDQNQVVSIWPATREIIEEALEANDLDDWEEQGLTEELPEFEKGNQLWLTITQGGVWIVPNRELLAERLDHHLGDTSPILAISWELA